MRENSEDSLRVIGYREGRPYTIRLSPYSPEGKGLYEKKLCPVTRYHLSRRFNYPRARFHPHFVPDTIAEMPRRGALREKTTVF